MKPMSKRYGKLLEAHALKHYNIELNGQMVIDEANRQGKSYADCKDAVRASWWRMQPSPTSMAQQLQMR